jgi:hypothetical protein
VAAVLAVAIVAAGGGVAIANIPGHNAVTLDSTNVDTHQSIETVSLIGVVSIAELTRRQDVRPSMAIRPSSSI